MATERLTVQLRGKSVSEVQRAYFISFKQLFSHNNIISQLMQDVHLQLSKN